MQVRINGKPEVIQESNLVDLLKSKNIEAQMVTVELNNKMIDRASLSETTLHEGDELEFIYFMGGGSLMR